MHKLLLASALLISGLVLSSTVLAAPILVTEHNYGHSGHTPAGPSSCGNIGSNHLLVRKNSNCTAFTDLFSLTNFDAAAIDYLELTLSFADTINCNALNGNCQNENWQLDILNGSGVKLGSFDLLQSRTTVQQSFIINRLNMALFTQLFSQGNLWFGFTETSTTNHNFRLYSSQLAIFALPTQQPTPVPAPATLALFGLGLVGLCLRRRLSR